jgi:hypothetical protein
MLGEMYGESTGKRVMRRTISVDPIKVEVNLEDSGKMLGVATQGFGTYVANVSPDGTLYGEGAGVISSQDGDMATWKGSGLGKLKPDGSVSYRGILYYRTESKKLAKLNAAPGVFEFEVDAQGNSHTKVWEWK